MLCDQLKRERIENAQQRGRSPAQRNRSRSANKYSAPAGGPDVSKLEQQVADLRRSLHGLEDENEKLKSTMREMVDDYTRQLELRDETIQRLD